MTVTTDVHPTEPVPLYGLSLKPDENENVGPYTWKTVINLRTLGVPYNLEGRTFDEIRGSFETETGNLKVTVPTVKTADGWVTGSWEIAEWAEDTYGTPERSLFAGGKAFARFFHTWADAELADTIKPLFAPWLYQAQDPASAAWFLKTKLGGNAEAIKGLIAASQTPAWVDSQTQAVRTALGTVERLLAANSEAGVGRFLAGTDYPTHADAAVYSWYASSDAVRGHTPSVTERTWFHESLPLVGRWVRDVEEASKTKLEYAH
ncbi:hypothetical protein CspHIS471_0209200 [Cutaneotrichosporon sp. HIS471]|nr:hypothetical protein CspHIS471_0209200 [Cutaneotrichosporon sp. HIS471]